MGLLLDPGSKTSIRGRPGPAPGFAQRVAIEARNPHHARTIIPCVRNSTLRGNDWQSARGTDLRIAHSRLVRYQPYRTNDE